MFGSPFLFPTHHLQPLGNMDFWMGIKDLIWSNPLLYLIVNFQPDFFRNFYFDFLPFFFLNFLSYSIIKNSQILSQITLYHNLFQAKVNWLSLLFVLDSMLTLSLLATAGIYWAREINKTLKTSSLSSQTKAMQRRMNNLLVTQVNCSIYLV